MLRSLYSGDTYFRELDQVPRRQAYCRDHGDTNKGDSPGIDFNRQEVNTLDTEVRNKQTQYSQAQNSYLTLQKKQQYDTTLLLIILKLRGNLSQKSLSGVVRRENVVLDSEYLETIFLAVPGYFSHGSIIDLIIETRTNHSTQNTKH